MGFNYSSFLEKFLAKKYKNVSLDYTKADEVIRSHSGDGRKLNKIAVLVFDISTLKRFSNILRCMPKSSLDVVYNCHSPQEIISTAQYYGYSCRSMASVLASKNTYLLTLSHNMWFAWHLNGGFLPNLLGEGHIRLIYSLGASNEVLSANHNYIYDTILCYGPYQKGILEKNTNAKIIGIGNPRLDLYFNNFINLEEIKKFYKLNLAKETIVYVPTVIPNSIKDFINVVEILSNKYNLLINVHPLTSNEDLQILANSKVKDNVIKTDDNIPLLAVADFIICDYGGAMFSAICMDKKILLFDVLDAENVAILGKDSAEFHVRKHIPGYSNIQANEIIKTLKDEQYWHNQQHIRQQLFTEFFTDYRGYSSYCAAKEIMRMMPNAV